LLSDTGGGRRGEDRELANWACRTGNGHGASISQVAVYVRLSPGRPRCLVSMPCPLVMLPVLPSMSCPRAWVMSSLAGRRAVCYPGCRSSWPSSLITCGRRADGIPWSRSWPGLRGDGCGRQVAGGDRRVGRRCARGGSRWPGGAPRPAWRRAGGAGRDDDAQAWAPDERTIQRMFNRTGLTALGCPTSRQASGESAGRDARAGDGNRTRMASLEGVWRTAVTAAELESLMLLSSRG